MPRPQFSLRTMLVAVAACAVAAAVIRTLLGTWALRLMCVSVVFSAGACCVFDGAHLTQLHPRAAWPVFLAGFGVLVILLAILVGFTYLTNGYGSA